MSIFSTAFKFLGAGLKSAGKKVLGWIAPGLSGLLQGLASNKLLNKELTGKERELNDFNAQQAALQRDFARDEREASQAFNADQAQQQMAFQERMGNTQYQRQIADMQAAGVNPAMAFGGITGASASGAMATSTPASGVAASGSGHLMGLSELLQFARIRKEMDLLDAQKQETYSRAHKNSVEAAGEQIYNQFRPQLFQQQLDKGDVEIEQIRQGIAESLSRLANIQQDTLNKQEQQFLIQAQRELALAQEELAGEQSKYVSAQAFEQRLRNKIFRETGNAPGTPIWNLLPGVSFRGSEELTKFGRWIKDMLSGKGSDSPHDYGDNVPPGFRGSR